MRLYCIACEVLARPLYLSAARSPHIVDIQLFRRGLHNNPADLRSRLQAAVDEASARTLPDGRCEYDYIVMGYGLCGQATAGLTARGIPVVVPRAHDCITLFLGSRDVYTHQFENFPGTYWYAQDYIERDDGSGSALALGAGSDTDLDKVYDEYVAKYGKDNADYLMEVMGAWQQHYKRAGVIDMGIGDISATLAQRRGRRGPPRVGCRPGGGRRRADETTPRRRLGGRLPGPPAGRATQHDL